MSPIPQLEEFLTDSLEDASLLNRYVTDTSSCLVYQTVLSFAVVLNYKLTHCLNQAFDLEGNSLLARVPHNNRKKLAELGAYKAAFNLKRHPAFAGNKYNLDTR